MTTLALDPSTTRTGWAIVSGPALVASGAIRGLRPDAGPWDRVDAILAHPVDRIAIEGQWVGGHRAQAVSAMVTVAVRAALQARLHAATGLPVEVIPPNVWRRALRLRGPRRDDYKSQALAFCGVRGWHPTCDDEAEAICIACFAEWRKA